MYVRYDPDECTVVDLIQIGHKFLMCSIIKDCKIVNLNKLT